jgi:hypothetical protein
VLDSHSGTSVTALAVLCLEDGVLDSSDYSKFCTSAHSQCLKFSSFWLPQHSHQLQSSAVESNQAPSAPMLLLLSNSHCLLCSHHHMVSSSHPCHLHSWPKSATDVNSAPATMGPPLAIPLLPLLLLHLLPFLHTTSSVTLLVVTIKCRQERPLERSFY